jgi:hypothetical protein
MFIVWGKKIVRDRIGYVADFCPLCREPKPFALNEVKLKPHVYYITTGSGSLMGYERSCQGCSIAFEAERWKYTATPARVTDIDTLIATSYPTLRDVYAERLRLEAALRSAPESIPLDLRDSLIKQPFHLLGPMVDAKLKRGMLDLVGWGVVAASVVAIGVVLDVTPDLAPSVAPQILGGVVLACVAAFIWAVASRRGRLIRRTMLPRLGRSLRPLRPTESELNGVLRELRRSRRSVASRVQAKHILQAVQEA